MHIVIDIPNTVWNKAKEYGHLDMCGIELSKIVMDGTPLPEGHGRLGDLDALAEEMVAENLKYDAITVADWCSSVCQKAPTIVEKDYGSLEEKYFGNPIDKTGIYANNEVNSEE